MSLIRPSMSGRDRYPEIAEYAFLSDTNTAALVAPDGTVEWMCAPRFDGASIFGRILDRDSGGGFFLSINAGVPSERRYVDDTLVLESRYESKEGVAMVSDFLSLETKGESRQGVVAPGRILCRLIECRKGRVDVNSLVDARLDYARLTPKWIKNGRGATAEAPGAVLEMASSHGMEIRNGAIEIAFSLREGESAAMALRYGTDQPDRPVDPGHVVRLRNDTVRAWRAWMGKCPYEGPARDLVRKSALALKGLFYHQSGALLAAPTTSLPEEVGGERNWDYRFSWVRDASMTLLALFGLGYTREGSAYLGFLLREYALLGDRLPLMIGIDGGKVPVEIKLDHLEGYAGSSPVRVGNDAAEQLQLDVTGEVLDAVLTGSTLTGERVSDSVWSFLVALVEWTCDNWHRPDNGIWEVRGGIRHFTHSKVMCWVAVDRGIRLAGLERRQDAPIARWRSMRDAIKADILKFGWDEDRASFVQAYGSTALDASALRFPLVGFIPGDDPRMVSTVQCIADELGGPDGLVYRYRADEASDGLSGDEGGFAICSFWLVSALALGGRRQEAEKLFAVCLDKASPLGLYAEEFAPHGGMLGNFPQAFTHLALIQAAMTLASTSAVP